MEGTDLMPSSKKPSQLELDREYLKLGNSRGTIPRYDEWVNSGVTSLTKAKSTDLSAADLSYANLRASNLDRAILREANLSNADLTGADLTGVDLTGVDLTGALMPDGLRHR